MKKPSRKNKKTDFLSEVVFSTIAFFLPDGEMTDRSYVLFVESCGGWAQRHKENEIPKEFLHRNSLFSSASLDQPWDNNDLRANSPIKLLNHMISIGWFSKVSPYYICQLKAYAVLFATKENKPEWKEQILTETAMLQYLEKKIYKQGVENFKESRSKQTKGLRQKAIDKELSNYRKMDLEKRIHDRATSLLDAGTPKREVVSEISSFGIDNLKGAPISIRGIRRYLETHPSGYWKPKKINK